MAVLLARIWSDPVRLLLGEDARPRAAVGGQSAQSATMGKRAMMVQPQSEPPRLFCRILVG